MPQSDSSDAHDTFFDKVFHLFKKRKWQRDKQVTSSTDYYQFFFYFFFSFYATSPNDQKEEQKQEVLSVFRRAKVIRMGSSALERKRFRKKELRITEGGPKDYGRRNEGETKDEGSSNAGFPK